MPKKRGPERDRAKEIYIQSNGKIPLIEIAKQIGVSEGTVRGWKSKDDWDGNGTPSSKDVNLSERSNKNMERSDKNTERSDRYAKSLEESTEGLHENTERSNRNTKRSDKNTERSNKNKKNPTNDNHQKSDTKKSEKKLTSKTNANSPKARFGNKNAAGYGAPVKNKNALKTGEYETLFFSGDIISENEMSLLNLDYDKYVQQYILIDLLTIREKRMLQRIKEIENTPGGMTMESITKTKGKLSIENTNRNKDGEEWPGGDSTQSMDNSTHNAKPVIKQVLVIEEALTRVQSKKQQALALLHRMEMDDERLCIDKAKLDMYRQRISGKVDIDSLFDDDIGFELDVD